MYQLPDPQHTRPAGQPTDADRDNIRRLMAAVDEIGAVKPTAVRVDDPAIPSWRDGPRVGDAPVVRQDDKRIVPAWAAGIAVASIGVGAGITGVGCGAWLVLNALASVTLNGVLIVTLPFAGLAMAATAIGGAINKAKRAAVPEIHNHNGTEYHEHNVDARRSVWSKTVNKH